MRVNEGQKIAWYSFSLNSCEESAAALEAASAPFGGRCPDALLLCAGSSRPGFFIEQTEEQMISGMNGGYWVQAWSALVGFCDSRYLHVGLALTRCSGWCQENVETANQGKDRPGLVRARIHVNHRLFTILTGKIRASWYVSIHLLPRSCGSLKTP